MGAKLDSGSGFGSGSGSKSGCLSSAVLGKKPWLSTLLAAQARFCAGLPSTHSRQGFAGGSGKQKLHLPGPWDAGRQPPMVWGAFGFFPPRMSALPRELWSPVLGALGRKKLKLTSGPRTVLWLVEKGSSSCQGPVKNNPDMFILVRVHLCLALWPNQISLDKSEKQSSSLPGLFLLNAVIHGNTCIIYLCIADQSLSYSHGVCKYGTCVKEF